MQGEYLWVLINLSLILKRTASARMANAIERAVQRAKGERAPGGGGEEPEVTVPQAAVRQCYKGHRNAR